MEETSHATIAGIEERNWWYVTRRAIFNNLMNRFAPHADSALDIGCGVGSNYPVLAAHAQHVIGLDISQTALDYVRAPYSEKVCTSAEEMAIPGSSIDVVLCADVLEHLDDHKTVREMHRILTPGGKAFVSVPAFESLWHGNDDYHHHLRRYRKEDLIQLFVAEGFTIRYVDFWNRLFFVPVWIVARFYRRGGDPAKLSNNLHAIPAWCDSILTWWMRVEQACARVVPLPFGVSLLLVAEKPRT